MSNSLRCPHCLSEHIKDYSVYETKNNGTRKLYQCIECHQVFSETKKTFLEGLKKPLSLIIKVLNARSEGMGFNAVGRVFEISKNTLLEWEWRFADLKGPLLIYALLHTIAVITGVKTQIFMQVSENT